MVLNEIQYINRQGKAHNIISITAENILLHTIHILPLGVCIEWIPWRDHQPPNWPTSSLCCGSRRGHCDRTNYSVVIKMMGHHPWEVSTDGLLSQQGWMAPSHILSTGLPSCGEELQSHREWSRNLMVCLPNFFLFSAWKQKNTAFPWMFGKYVRFYNYIYLFFIAYI
jgi:hypothetical protein